MDNLKTGYLFKKIDDALERKANNRLKAKGLTMSQAYVLMQLIEAEEGFLPLKAVERSLGVAQPTAAGIVSRLEIKGLVASFPDENDKRVKLLSLTEKGVEAAKGAENGVRNLNNDMFTGLADEEMETLHKLLHRVYDNVKN